ncbi:type I restriction enzyme HsdR N-terminal domain-containing protein [Aminobacter aminovorans]|uniref:Type I restriction enzyme R protein N-terminal domain-containing protein n=1 Tax=Aminobacter aminovorans TaxID=83263 RepID=A0AAC9ASC8_AMIAI|nr:type I restriction enzyme HsdR N-terminal domain-containing protein [Aminobacter aminovorans]AMS43381.1 hypothetical protein AA2016_4469 [Aminobacter aminovorans]MBB3706061.1 hypothetical protein [Aminobacter aminovorans]
MFPNFDPSLFLDPEFKEDSVREVIIAPILTRLGYSPSGEHRVVRSKVLNHPFIYAGTKKLPVKMIPDYTLKSGDRVVLVLDAKQPRENVLSREAVQQVYSYAIHPEVKSEHFALCNGKQLVVFNVDQSDPLLIVEYADFEKSWEEIDKYLSPRMLKEPIFRRFAPDFGCALARLGLAEGAVVTLLPASFGLVARLDDKMMTASANVDFAEKPHCVSFDFERRHLPVMLSCLPGELAKAFSNALERAPFQAAAELAIELDLETKLGPEIQVEAETFRPLVVQEVISSRFNPTPLANEASDIPAHVFRLRSAFVLKR